MSRSSYRILFCSLAVCLFILANVNVPAARAQEGVVGTIAVTVVDQSGAVVSGAALELRDLATNDVRTGATQDKGVYTFIGLSVGTYALTVSKTGFEKQVFDTVVVHAAQVTGVNAILRVGVATQVVEVHESAAPIVETTSNAIGTTIDMKQIEDLPLGGRDITQLSYLIPGAVVPSGVGATWNGLPAIAQGNNIDGVISSTSRMKFGGDSAPMVSARIEDMQEMTVQTDQMDANQGYGQAAMQLNFVTRRGTNSFHGRLFEDFQNSYLNANTWFNDSLGIEKGHFELNDFGGSLGGPILKDKLFFFGTFAEEKSPATLFPSATVLSPNAQLGAFAYVDQNTKQIDQVCLFTATCPAGWTNIGKANTGIVDQYNAANTASLPTSLNSVIGQQLQAVNGVLSAGKVATLNPNDPSQQTLTWAVPNPFTEYFPALRIDYTASQSVRLNFAWNETKQANTIAGTGGAGFFPGALSKGMYQYNYFNNYTAALGLDWTVRPTLVNQFRGGFFYNNIEWTNSEGFANAPTLVWGLGTSPQQALLASGQYYPLFNASDTMTWQHGAHTFSFGFSWWREQDHYYNPPGGLNIYGLYLGLAGGDPANNVFTNQYLPNANGGALNEAGQLYATLAGRIQCAGTSQCYNFFFAGNPVDLKTGQYNTKPVATYNLDEVIAAKNLFIQDSFRIKPSLTLNYAIGLGFTGDNYDITGAYHSISSVNDMYGPSGPSGLFNPGTLAGNADGGTLKAEQHHYKPWDWTPNPQFGLAWNPTINEGFLGKLMGGSSTVVRAGFSLRHFTEPQQYFWNNATDYAAFYFQQFAYVPSTSNTNHGYFSPGTLSLASSSGTIGNVPGGQVPGNILQLANLVPQTYLTSATQSQLEFQPGAPGLAGLDPNIKQPYNQSWNLGIQRQIGRSNVLEVRYLGGRSVHQWITEDLNEVNIFENGFLTQFKQAQKNLALNNALPTTNPYYGTFAYNSAVAGEADLPIFDAAFAGESGSLQSQDWGNSGYVNSFVYMLQNGEAGALASALTQTFSPAGANPICNLVGTNLGPCGTAFGYKAAGAYPSNFFQVNPFYTGSGASLMMAGGYSTYQSLQIDFRQRAWHGMQFDANYVWSHNLSMNSPNNWQGNTTELTIRNPSLSYTPTLYDIRHAVHFSGTYDLPFGGGKRFLNHSGLLDRVVGDWTFGTIFTFQTGVPFRLSSGYPTLNTYNDYADGGVVLNGISRSQLQGNVGVYKCFSCGASFVDFINPSVLNSFNGGVKNGFATPNTVPGTVLPPIFLYGPHLVNDDLSVTKIIRIRENIRFSLQGEFLNVFNHPNFTNLSERASYTGGDFGVQDSTFGQLPGWDAQGPRAIEIRANFEF